ncbi:MAG: AtpZ/AtpI family protein [Pseudomonadota bacterium]
MNKKREETNTAALDDLSKRLDVALGRRDTKAEKAEVSSTQGQALGAGLKLASELIAAVIIGLVLGLGVDRFLNMSPFGLLIGLFIGFAAGLRNALASFGVSATTLELDGDKDE